MSRFIIGRVVVALFCVSLLAFPITAQEDARATEIPLKQSSVERFGPDEAHKAQIEFAVGDSDDPPALLAMEQLGSMKALARQLSDDRSWMRPEILLTLMHQDLRLDEVFVDAPERVTFADRHYRIELEMHGEGWQSFDPNSDDFVVFLSHEIYDGFGDDKALAFEAGHETTIFDFEVEQGTAISLTLADIPSTEGGRTRLKAAPLQDAIHLGAAELRMTPERLPVHLYPNLHRIARSDEKFSAQSLAALADDMARLTAMEKSSCTQEIAPTSCIGNRPACPSGYTPYFVLDQIKISQDHEGAFKGNPEIELFPLRIDVASPLGSNTTAETDLWFYGQNVTDLAGRTRYLPDVNNTNIWYTVTNGVAIFPLDLGYEFSAMLVEQDDDRGVLRVKSTKINVTKVYERVSNIVQVITDWRSIDQSFLMLFKNLAGLIKDIIGLFNDGDDVFQESLGVNNNLFCGGTMGLMSTYTLTSQEWAMRGHFACINPSCPDPGSGGGGGGGGGGDDWGNCGGFTPIICR